MADRFYIKKYTEGTFYEVRDREDGDRRANLIFDDLEKVTQELERLTKTHERTLVYQALHKRLANPTKNPRECFHLNRFNMDEPNDFPPEPHQEEGNEMSNEGFDYIYYGCPDCGNEWSEYFD